MIVPEIFIGDGIENIAEYDEIGVYRAERSYRGYFIFEKIRKSCEYNHDDGDMTSEFDQDMFNGYINDFTFFPAMLDHGIMLFSKEGMIGWGSVVLGERMKINWNCNHYGSEWIYYRDISFRSIMNRLKKDVFHLNDPLTCMLMRRKPPKGEIMCFDRLMEDVFDFEGIFYKSVLAKFMTGSDIERRPDIVDKLCSDKNWIVRKQMAENHFISKEDAYRMACDKDWRVRVGFCHGKNTALNSIDEIAPLLEDPEFNVRVAAAGIIYDHKQFGVSKDQIAKTILSSNCDECIKTAIILNLIGE